MTGPGRSSGRGPGARRRAVFLDRDGTIIEDRRYLADPAGVALIPGAAQAIARFRQAGYAVVVVTNQSGIGRGLFSLAEYHAVAREVERRLAREGARLDATCFCPDAPGQKARKESCRKPSTVMHRRAARDLDLELRGSWFVGDKSADVAPATQLGGRGILVLTGEGEAHASAVGPEVTVVSDLLAAAELVGCGRDGMGG